MCHWESSRRPLYVKTVWTNGHHHAILTPEDPYLKTQVPTVVERKSFSVLSRQRSAKNVYNQTPKSDAEDVDLTISTVQILLDGLRNGKSRSKRASASSLYQIREREHVLQKAPTIAVIPMDRLKMRNMNEDIEFVRGEKRKNRRSNSYDVGLLKDDKNWMEPYVSGITNLGQQNTGNVLSERVMLWLDLARQSQENRIKKYDQDKRNADAEKKSANKKLLTITTDWIPYLNYDGKDIEHLGDDAYAVGKNNNDDLHFNDLSILKSSPIKLTQSGGAIHETVSDAHQHRKPEKNDEGTRNSYTNVTVVSTKIEEFDGLLGENEMYNNMPRKYSVATNKRQLHIFMPNVPKKKIDTDGKSILSDISSHYSTKVKFAL